MKELISIAVLIATLFGGTLAAEKIYCSVREAALTKAAHGLPNLARFGNALTSSPVVNRDGVQGHDLKRHGAKYSK